MKKFIYLLFIFFVIPDGFAQLNSLQFDQIDSLQIVEKRNIVVFIHVNWCKYCQVMKSKTFKDKTVVEVLNKKFYFIDLNGEEKRKIVFNNAVFNFKPNGFNSGMHELANELGTINNQINYPVLCVLNYKNEIIFQNNSFLNAKDLILILKEIK